MGRAGFPLSPPVGISRRHILKAGMATLVTVTVAKPAAAATSRVPLERSLQLYNCQTGEWLKETYWAQGQYIPDVLKQVNWLMRDCHNGKEVAIDPTLLDLLHEVRTRI